MAVGGVAVEYAAVVGASLQGRRHEHGVERHDGGPHVQGMAKCGLIDGGAI